MSSELSRSGLVYRNLPRIPSAVMLPIPIGLGLYNLAELDELNTALDEIAKLGIKYVIQSVPRDTATAGYVFEILERCRLKGFRCVLGFDERLCFTGPIRNREWALGPVARIFNDPGYPNNVTHSALHAFATIGEPYDPDVASYADMNRLYLALRPASGTPGPAYLRKSSGPDTFVPQWVNFFGQLELYQGDSDKLYDVDICDIAAITKLAFRETGTGEPDPYLRRQLIDAHLYSRRIIREKTPDVPIWTQIPAFAVGPDRFASPMELKDYLNLVLKDLGGTASRGGVNGPYGDMALERITWQRWAHRDSIEGGFVMRDPEGALFRYWAARLARIEA